MHLMSISGIWFNELHCIFKFWKEKFVNSEFEREKTEQKHFQIKEKIYVITTPL